MNPVLRSTPSSEEKRQCWVCFANDEDDGEAEWVKPCRCKGSARWVHHACLQRWIDEKQRGNSSMKVACPQCGTEYIIIFPKSARFLVLMEALDGLIQKSSPFVAGVIVLGSLYWTAVTYGAITVMQAIMVLGRMVRWEEAVLKLWRKYSEKILPFVTGQKEHVILPSRNPALVYTGSDQISVTRLFCGAIVFPTIATVVGKLFFNSVKSNLQRTVLGGITFVIMKGFLKLYLQQTRYNRQLTRRVMDYENYESMLRQTGTQTDSDSTTASTR